MSEERWLPVVGYEGLYEVSDQGHVRSVERVDSYGRHRKTRVLKPNKNGSGHYQVRLYRNGRSESYSYVHRLVLEAFVGPCPEGMVGCHYDDVKEHNRLENLRWGTSSSNRFDAVRNGNDYNARKTHCKYGHEFTPENTRYCKNGGRACRQCSKWKVRQEHSRSNTQADVSKGTGPRTGSSGMLMTTVTDGEDE